MQIENKTCQPMNLGKQVLQSTVENVIKVSMPAKQQASQKGSQPASHQAGQHIVKPAARKPAAAKGASGNGDAATHLLFEFLLEVYTALRFPGPSSGLTARRHCARRGLRLRARSFSLGRENWPFEPPWARWGS